jgi:hypothetical protein
MNKWFIAPISFIQVKGVFSHFAVYGNQALLIEAVFTAFITAIGSEVKHIPDICRPKPGTLLDHLKHMLMIDSLITLGIVSPLWIRALEP